MSHDNTPSLSMWQRCKSGLYHAGYSVVAATRGMSSSTSLAPNQPVFLCGTMYETRTKESLREFLLALEKFVLFTYRKDFIPIWRNELTFDTGWGCMLRTGQMMMCQALIRAFPRESTDYMGLFRDIPNAPFSVHKIASVGQERYGVNCGEWFSPTVMCNVMSDLMNEFLGGKLHVTVANDAAVLLPEVEEYVVKQKMPTIVLIPLMLGMGEISETYHNPLLQCLEFRQSIGIVGGKPKLSLYFIGKQGTKLLYLDPHSTVQAAFVNSATMGVIHEKRTFNADITQLDPSLFIGFVVKDKPDYDNWLAMVTTLVGCKWPMFSLQKTASSEALRAIQRDAMSPRKRQGFEDFDFV